ncbi:hypothetical protein DL546_007809 [Coniochaeta pulveracea]|uniref:Complex I intermediate-associated protein 84, mitochondrial n=1 Tax=Coniochaeta pulveracea TaxID=177199 RepID=A0A420YFG0_9PEZI|nr:hypothetical protein DL546_007809 [Coniochaeta pulveracea]
MLKMHRPPPRTELIQGWRTFFDHKLKHNKTVNSSQAFVALRLLRHLVETRGQDEDGRELTVEDLRKARDALCWPAKKVNQNQLELSKLVFQELERIRDAQEDVEKNREDFRAFMQCMTAYGGSTYAVERLEEYWRGLLESGRIYKGAKFLWVLASRGLAMEGKEEELVDLCKRAEEYGVDFSPRMHEVVVTYFASRDRVQETKHWFKKPIYGNYRASPETYRQVLLFGVRNNQYSWLRVVFEDLRQSRPIKALWDVIFQWAVLAENKGLEEVRHMMETATHLQKANDERPVDFGVSTLNSLVEAATEKKDPYLAERIISMCIEMGIQPNSTTYLLQMDYRIEAKDLSGADAAYQKLATSYITDEQEDLPVVNKYIRALCEAKKPDTERILEITRSVEERDAQLEPETVASLCIVFLKADQEFEVMDTLSLHATRMSIEEREKVERAFVAYILDRKNSTARAWDAYTLLRQFFPETDAEDRIRLMGSFFDRKRPDMACLVFGHMRAAATPSHRPTKEVYVQCLEGLGRCPDPDSLKMVHNMLKMDTTIQPDTRLYNALMIGYLGCNQPSTAFEFWNDISHSVEGPTYNSLAIVFRVCESMPFGDRRARAIWEKLQRMDLDIPPSVFAAYCGAIAGQGKVEEVKKVITGGGGEVTLMTLGIAYNALPGPDLKVEFEEWASSEYPEIWSRLLKTGRRTNRVDYLTQFKIVREMKA